MVLVLSSLLVIASAAVPAADASAYPSHPAADSTAIVKSVRSAQASFEGFRRNRLPRGESHGGECDVRIGRYCYWRGDEDIEDPPPEPLEIGMRRGELIAKLDSAAGELPGDGWIAAQRIRYLAEADRTDDALLASEQCRADRWWCAALGGYAAHVAGRFSTADSLYAVALDAMPQNVRCEWMDIREIVDGALEDRLKKADCAAREATARRIFWFGAPFWSVSQTDLLTEHLARLTRARMVEKTASPDGVPWGNDIRTLMLRYGWSRWFTRTEPAFGSTLQPSITGHDAGMPYYFMPAPRTMDGGPREEKVEWRLDDPRAVSGYAPSYARSMHELTSQVACFRRGDSTLVVAAWDVRRDSTLVGRELDVALVLAAPETVLTVDSLSKQRAVGRISAIAPRPVPWASLELRAPEDRRAGRLRVELAPQPSGRIQLSDLLLYAPTETQVADLASARDEALGTDQVPASRAVGVFWELYGAAPQGEDMRFALTVEQVEIGWRQRLAERLRFADPTTATRLEWQERAQPADGIAPRGIRLDLGRLRAGRYRLELTTTARDGTVATTSREIDVRQR
jgi:hypothetical protein